MGKVWFLGISLGVLLGFGCKPKVMEKRVTPPVIIDVMVAHVVTFKTNTQVNGSVLSEDMAELHPEVSGLLVYLNIPDGARVEKGTMLAKINDADLEAQLEQQQVQLDLASKTEKRLAKLLAVNGVNQADYDAALSSVNVYKANIKVLTAQINKCIIKAPFDGQLGLRQVSLGAYVNPQTLIGTLQQTDKTKIDFAVPEAFIDLVKVGNEVAVETNEGEKKLVATVSSVEPMINVDSRNLKVRARLKEGSLQLGSFVKISLEHVEHGIMVPSNAIIPDANSNQLVVVKGGRANFVNVATGNRGADMVEIKSGIADGDTVVVSGVLFVRSKALVKVRKVVDFSNDSETKELAQ